MCRHSGCQLKRGTADDHEAEVGQAQRDHRAQVRLPGLRASGGTPAGLDDTDKTIMARPPRPPRRGDRPAASVPRPRKSHRDAVRTAVRRPATISVALVR